MEWFENWFDSKYYHVLYKNRDKKEATTLINNLLNRFKFSKHSTFLDLACGTGRHSVYLNNKGFKVEGVDLSRKSLEKAKIYESKTLKFYCEDIRNFRKPKHYDVILNLFTSFGYFQNESDNQKVFQNIHESLKNKGLFILDFFNTNKVISKLKEHEIKIINNIRFEITKKHDGDFVYKNICVTDNENKHTFTEKVQLIRKDQFINYTTGLNMKLINSFGDYHFNNYDHQNSERLILVFQKD